MLLHDTFTAIPIDRNSLPQGKLDIAERVRTNPFPWTGQFSPQLVEELLIAYAPSSGVVLDPFIGSGTLLIEAARRGLTAYGGDVNPAAIILTKVYEMINLDISERTLLLDNLEERLLAIISSFEERSLFKMTKESTNRTMLESELVCLWQNSPLGLTRNLVAALIVLCDFYRKYLDVATIRKNWLHLKNIVEMLPKPNQMVTVYHADARAVPMESDSVDLVLTSPPYINVHNYHQKFRRSVEALGWDILAIARSEIGSNRQNRGNRFLTVIQYSLDMALALMEMARVTKCGGRLILVLGRESSVKGVRFFNGSLVTEIAVQSVGLQVERRQERMFRNRYGAKIYEDILHFRVTNNIFDKDSSLGVTRHIAQQVLVATAPLVSHKERMNIDDAIARVNTVSPSPMTF